MIWFGNYFYFTWGKGFSVVAIYDPLAIQNTNFDYKMQEFPNFTITTWRVEFLLTKCQNAYIVSQKWKIMRNFINSFFWEYKKNLNVTGGWNPIEHDIIIKLWLNSSLVMSAMIRQKKKIQKWKILLWLLSQEHSDDKYYLNFSNIWNWISLFWDC